MKKPFLMGFPSSIESSFFQSTRVSYNATGDNTGNLAFCYAINRSLGGNLGNVLWNIPPNEISNNGDIGILTLSNQLGDHTDFGFLVNNFNTFDISMIGIGLGAQANLNQDFPEISSGTIEWIRAIQEKSPTSRPNIGVRGDFTLKVMDKYGLADKAIVLGCPTLFINPARNLGKIIHDRFQSSFSRIAVTAGHQEWAELSKIENSLVKICQENDGAYICQSPLEMVQLGRGEARLLDFESLYKCRQYLDPSMSEYDFIKWTEKNAYSFFSVFSWMEFLRRFDFIIGTRIHGVLLGLQVGIPGLCIVHDSRTLELCQTMCVPYVKASDVDNGITRNDIYRLFDFDYKLFDENRIMRAKAYVDFLVSNNLNPAPYLLGLATG